MSNTKASKVITAKSTANIITADQFNSALESIKANGTSTQASIKTAVTFIMQQTNYKDQQAAIKDLAKVYVAFKKVIGDVITMESAARWIKRQILSIDSKYRMLKSESAAAKTKAKQRAARQAKAKADAKPAPKAEPKTETSIVQFRNALIEKELKLQQEFRNVIPSGKVKEFDQAFAAFISTIEMILK